MILVTSDHLNQMTNHALDIYPEECCGLLLGIIKDFQKVLIEVFPTQNNWTPQEDEMLSNLSDKTSLELSKKNRFSIAPEVLLKVQKQSRDRQLQIIGVYHSHPDYPAIPSELDRAIAWAEYSYIIMSVTSKKVTDIQSWELDERRQFQPEDIQLLF